MDRKEKQLNSIVAGGLLLTLSSFISKFLSAIYKIPFQNLTGDEGFYVYQQVYPLYGLAVALTMTGLPIFVSKVISETTNEIEIKERMQELHTWFVLIGVTFFMLLQLGAGVIASGMGDVGLVPVIQVVSYFFLFSPILALVRGYFQGQTNMMPTSISQVIEQIVRVGILLWVAFSFGSSSWSFYDMGKMAYHSAWISAAVGVVTLFYFVNKYKEMNVFKSIFKLRLSTLMGKRILTEGVLLVAVGSLMVLLQFIDSFTVYNGLIEAGFTDQLAMSVKGVYDRGQPLVQLGMVVGISFSMTSLPILRKRAVEKKWTSWAEEAGSIIKLTTLLSGAASIGLASVMPWMNETLFTDRNGTDVLQVMMLSIFWVSFIYCVHTVLQSSGEADYSLLALLAGLAFKWIMNQLAVRHLGLMGSSLVTVLSLVIIAILMVLFMDKAIFKKVLENKFLLKWLFLLTALYGSVTFGLTGIENVLGITGRVNSLILTLVGVVIGVIVFGGGGILLDVLTEDELEQLPLPRALKGKKRK